MQSSDPYLIYLKDSERTEYTMLMHYANLWVFHTLTNEVKTRVWQWLLHALIHILNFKFGYYFNADTMCANTQVCRQEEKQPGDVGLLLLCSLRSVNNCGNPRQICISDPPKGQATIQRHCIIQSMLHLFFPKRLNKSYTLSLLKLSNSSNVHCHIISYLSSDALTFMGVTSVATTKCWRENPWNTAAVFIYLL